MSYYQNRIKGCLMGLFVGDAVGATLEFRSQITDDDVRYAMTLPGGGRINVAPGQVTDDSELAIHLLRALHKKSPHDGFPKDEIAKEYITWFKSDPFDMGRTCRCAFGFANNAEEMILNAQKYNMNSEANGSLMRIAPLAIWLRHTPDKIIEYAHKEAILSHPNPVCRDVNAMYCIALVGILNGLDPIQFLDSYESEIQCEIVRRWYHDSKTLSLDDIVCNINIGHVKHAFILVFYFLRNKVGFEEALYETLRKGGDTDTNAAIVCAMLGAFHGYDSIPDVMKTKVLQFDCASHKPMGRAPGYNRPNIYRISDALQILESLS